jgi:hypothetical protein
MATVLANKQAVQSEKSAAVHAAMALLVMYVLAGGVLLAMGSRNHPALHIMLDAGITLSAGMLALTLWVMGRHANRRLLTWLAIGFGATALLELIHLLAIADWPAASLTLRQPAETLQAVTWGPAAHLLPIAIAGSLWLAERKAMFTLSFIAVVAALAAGLLIVFQYLPTSTAPSQFGMTQPTLIVVPLLWLAILAHCWRGRATDGMLRALALMAPALLLGSLAMLYSQREDDSQAIVAHLGTLVGHLVLFLMLMKLASAEMTERVRAEMRLAQLIDEQERRVRERTADLESEVAVRREAEQNAQMQLRRLHLLHQITRAIGDRQDLNSIYEIVVRSLEEQLPVDLCCLCLHDAGAGVLTVAKVGPHCAGLARRLGLAERTRLPIDCESLAHSVRGTQVSEPDTSLVASRLSQRLAEARLRSLVVSPLQLEGRVFGVLIVARAQASGFSSGKCKFLRQLCEHVALAAHQTELYVALQQAYEDLQQTQHGVLQQERLRALGQMASGIGHDINNALSPIALHTETLLETEHNLSPRGRESLLTIQRAMNNIAQTVARMREFYRPRAAESAQAPVQINPIALQAIDMTRALARHAAAGWTRHHSEDRPCSGPAGDRRHRERDSRGADQSHPQCRRCHAEWRHAHIAHKGGAKTARARCGLCPDRRRRYRHRHE